MAVLLFFCFNNLNWAWDVGGAGSVGRGPVAGIMGVFSGGGGSGWTRGKVLYLYAETMKVRLNFFKGLFNPK